MKGMIKDALILFAITLIAGLMLGVVNDITKEPIAKQEQKAKTEACQNVFADAASFEEAQLQDATQALTDAGITGADIDELMEAKDASGALLGYVITVTDHEGYGGDIQFSMGVTTDGILNGISLLSISETAGLGMKAGEVLVPQFENKNVSRFSYTKTGSTGESEIDAISGATITTNAVVNGVNAGLVYFDEFLKGGSAQ